jgi:hypothetical protein
MMMSWIEDNVIVGQENDVLDLKKELMKKFECEDYGPMNEYIGCMIETSKSGGIKFLKVLLQSYRLVWAKKVSLAAICLVAGSASFGIRIN